MNYIQSQVLIGIVHWAYVRGLGVSVLSTTTLDNYYLTVMHEPLIMGLGQSKNL